MCRSYTSAPWRKVSAADVPLMATQSPTAHMVASRPFHGLGRNAIGCAACKFGSMSKCRTSSAHPRVTPASRGTSLITSAETAPLGATEGSFAITSAKTYGEQTYGEQALSVGFAPALKHCEQCIGAQPKLSGAGALPMLLIRRGSCQPGLGLRSDDREL